VYPPSACPDNRRWDLPVRHQGLRPGAVPASRRVLWGLRLCA